MKKAIIFALFVILSLSATAGNKKKLFPKVKDGGTIDADFLNQVTMTIENKVLGFQGSEEILGQWECSHITTECGYEVGQHDGGMVDKGLYQIRTQTITFSQDVTGDYQYLTDETALNGCRDDASSIVRGSYLILNNIFFYKVEWVNDSSASDLAQMFPLNKYSDNSFNILFASDRITTCERLNVPPAFPTALEAVYDATSDIILTWSDNGTTEEGFNVYRRTITDPTADIPDYLVIKETGLDVVEYTDSDCVGDCYYKIRAFNVNGESAASNVVKMTN